MPAISETSASHIRLQLARKNSGREVAVRALLRAERIGDVDARHLQRNFFAQLFGDGVLDQFGQRLAARRQNEIVRALSQSSL
jgi:hypothetical protein